MRAQKVAQLGWGDRFVFSVRAWPSSCGPAHNTEGGTALYFFQIVEASKNLFHLCIAIVDIANLTSLCLQVHTVIFYICPKYHPCVRAIICFFWHHFLTQHTRVDFSKCALNTPSHLANAKKMYIEGEYLR